MTRSAAGGTRDALDQYLKEINRVALLTVPEERRLAREFLAGDKRAGHRLVEANLRFVVKVAFEYRSYGLRMADLIQEGNLGLMRAVQKFDPGREIRLISYAVWWIRAYIQNHILRSWSLVKIGTTQAQRKLFFSLSRARAEIERVTPGSGVAEATSQADLIARKLKVRATEVVEMSQRMVGRDQSLDAPIGDGTSTHLELTPDDSDGQEEALANAQVGAVLSRRVAEALGHLDPRERQIVEARLLGDGKQTLRDLGKQFGFSRERARQLELRAREKLRRDLRPVAEEVGWPVAAADAQP